jgi:hypothetical protein
MHLTTLQQEDVANTDIHREATRPTFQHIPPPRTITQILTPPYEHTILNHIRETPTPVRTS